MYYHSVPIRDFFYKTAHCPACNNHIVEFSKSGNIESNFSLIYPQGAARGPVPAEVPTDISSDYTESCNVLHISAKASAALSRRCLQNILRQNGYTSKDLAKEIDLLLAEPDPTKALPTKLRVTVDGIRNFGNFSAHPIDDKSSLQIIEVEPHEAEWCLEILEELFDHFYVGPSVARTRKARLDAKLLAAGKPPSK
jgi:hypothetical protein